MLKSLLKIATNVTETAIKVVDVAVVKPTAGATKIVKDVVDAVASEIDPNDHS